jgi:hypothetical protein
MPRRRGLLDYIVISGDERLRAVPIRIIRYRLLIPIGITLFVASFMTSLSADSFPFWARLTIAMTITWCGGANLADVWNRHRQSHGIPRMMDDPAWTPFDTGVVCYAAMGLLALISNPLISELELYSRLNIVVLGLIFWLGHLILFVARMGRRKRARAALTAPEEHDGR